MPIVSMFSCPYLLNQAKENTQPQVFCEFRDYHYSLRIEKVVPRTCKRHSFTFYVYLTILKGCDRRDRPDRRTACIDGHCVHGWTLFIFTFLMSYSGFKRILISVIVMCICVCTFCGDQSHIAISSSVKNQRSENIVRFTV
jgi:hypothetical protein